MGYKNLIIGQRFESLTCGEFAIAQVHGNTQIDVMFINTGYIVEGVNYAEIIKGAIKDAYHPAVFSFGYLGKGKYKCWDNVAKKKTRAYSVWANMIKRCYDPNTQARQPSYIGCEVCDDWACFQIFAEWFDANYITGYELDKDVMGDSKLYSPATCMFISKHSNLIEAANRRSNDIRVIDPNNLVHHITTTITKFCLEHDLTYHSFRYMISGKTKNHKGWRLHQS